MRVLVTGGAGYIGSHAALRLLLDGHDVVTMDNLSRGHAQAEAVLSGIGQDRYTSARCDLHETEQLTELLGTHSIDVVMHFAAFADVAESIEHPLRFYKNNVGGTISLLRAMTEAGTSRMVFSSSCSTYGEPDADQIPICETTPQRPINPYGFSKLMCERVLADLSEAMRRADRPFAWAALRYFNVVGCDSLARVGEDHRPASRLIPVCLEAALGKRPQVSIFGTDFPTPDGTCIRDYVHVEDLIDAHVRVIEALEPGDARRYNVGTGTGVSVRECIESAKRVTGVDFPVDEVPRRPGDPPMLHADTNRIREELDWTAQVSDIDEMVESSWRWFQQYPDGWPQC